MDRLLASNASHSMNLLQLVEYYHRKKPKHLKYKSICTVLNKHHRVSISERRLKYILKSKDIPVKQM